MLGMQCVQDALTGSVYRSRGWEQWFSTVNDGDGCWLAKSSALVLARSFLFRLLRSLMGTGGRLALLWVYEAGKCRPTRINGLVFVAWMVVKFNSTFGTQS